MTKYIFLLVLFLGLFSCSDKESELGTLGEWQLTATLLDPGDGSGTFQSVDSDKTLSFLTTGVVEVKNGTLCDIGSNNDEMEGTYDAINMTITVDCNNNLPFDFTYEITADNELLLNYPCIEPCVEKYEMK